MRKVLFFSENVPFGGQESMLCLFADELSRRNYEVSFCASKSILDFIVSKKIKKTILDINPKKMNGIFGIIDLARWIKVYRLLKKINPEVLIVSQGTIEYGLVAIILGKFFKIKTVSYIPILQELDRRKFWGLNIVREWINDRWYSVADCYVTISESLSIKLGLKTSKKVYVLTNWLNASCVESRPNLDPNLEDQLLNNLHDDDVIFAVIGRVVFSHKRQDKIVKLFSQIRQPNQKLVIFGDGTDDSRLRKILLELCDSNIMYFGRCNEVHSLYRYIDVLLIGSSDEGVPLVMLEAITHNVKVESLEYLSTREYLNDRSIHSHGLENMLFDVLSKYHSKLSKPSIANKQFLVPNELQLSSFIRYINE